MNCPITNHGGEVKKGRAGDLAQVRIIILALVCFVMGLAVGALWFARKASAQGPSQTYVTREIAASPSGSPEPQPLPQPADLIDRVALDAVKRSISNWDSTSLEAGIQILREAAVAEFQQTVQELQARQKKVEENFIKGQNSQSGEQQQIATKQLRELQMEQMEKLQQIAAKSKAQMEAFQQLKGASR